MSQSTYSLVSTTDQIELRPRQIEDGLVLPRHNHKRSSSSTSFVHFKVPPLHTETLQEDVSLQHEIHHLASQVLHYYLFHFIAIYNNFFFTNHIFVYRHFLLY